MSTQKRRTRLVMHCGIILLVATAATAARPALADVVDPFQGGPTELILFNDTAEQPASEPPLPCREACAEPGRTGQGEGSKIKLVNTETSSDSQQSKSEVHNADFQINAPATNPAAPTTPTTQSPFSDDSANDLTQGGAPSKSPAITKDPCAAVPVKPYTDLGISIAQPEGRLPTDLAATCWEQINHKEGPNAASRAWPVYFYQWDAT
jgi:hypothetical protein